MAAHKLYTEAKQLKQEMAPGTKTFYSATRMVAGSCLECEPPHTPILLLTTWLLTVFTDRYSTWASLGKSIIQYATAFHVHVVNI
jgi:hypothetical protein